MVLGLGINPRESKDWKNRMTEYRTMQFYLHWIYNKIIWDFKIKVEVTGILTHDISEFRGSTVINSDKNW